MQERQSIGVQVRGDIRERFTEIRRTHVVEVSVWRQAHRHTIRRPDGENRLHDLLQKAIAVLHASAVAIRPLIRPGVEELVDQVAVRRVDFHAIEFGGLRPLRCPPVVLHHRRNFRRLQGARRLVGLLADGRVDGVAIDLDGRGRHRRLPAMKAAVRRTPAVPELEKEGRPAGTKRRRDLLPARHLRIVVNAR